MVPSSLSSTGFAPKGDSGYPCHGSHQRHLSHFTDGETEPGDQRDLTSVGKNSDPERHTQLWRLIRDRSGEMKEKDPARAPRPEISAEHPFLI